MNEEQIEKAKEIPIEDFLLERGYKPVRKGGSKLYYLSMLRDEKESSFCVNMSNNKWRDFGLSGRWDDIIGLVQEMDKCGFMQAVEKLVGTKIVKSRKVTNEPQAPGIEIENITPLKAKLLIDYLKSRGVDIDIARLYCQQAVVSFPTAKKSEQKHTYIAFRNDKGGYEFRNHYKTRIAKVSSSPKYFTRIEAEPNRYNIFEGFIDFLSMLTKYQKQKFKNTTVVLNSLVNIRYLYETLKTNEENNIFLDNEEDADRYIWKGGHGVESLKEQGIPYIDRREMFGIANDINDMINGRIYI